MNTKVEILGAYTHLQSFIELLNDGAILFTDKLEIIGYNRLFREISGLGLPVSGANLSTIFAFPAFAQANFDVFHSELLSFIDSGAAEYHYKLPGGDSFLIKRLEPDTTENIILIGFLHKSQIKTGFEEYLGNASLLNQLANATGIIYYVQNIMLDQFLFFTDTIEQQLGYTIEDVNRIKFHKIIKKIEKAGTSSVQNMLPGQNAPLPVLVNEYLLQKKDGTSQWYEERAVKIKDPKGRNVGQFGSLRDLSAEKNLSASLRETKQQLQNFSAQTPLGLALVQNEHLVFANPVAMKILEIKDADLHSGEIPASLTRGGNCPCIAIFREMKASGEQSRDFENTIVTSIGEKAVIRGKALATQKDGQFAIQVIFQDVTNQNRQEKVAHTIKQILEASDTIDDLDEFYAFIHKTIAALIPIENFYISLVDKTTATLTFPYFIDVCDVAEPIPLDRKGLTHLVIRTGTSWLVNSETDAHLRAIGEVELIGEPTKIWLGVPLKIQNVTIGAIVIQDYTDAEKYTLEDLHLLEPIAFSISRAIERKAQEKERNELIRQLRDINASKDKLFSIVSHDLRTPFNSIIGFINILITEYEQLPPEELLSILHSLRRVSKGAFEMLTNLLEFSRFQRGHMEFEPDILSLNEAISNMQAMVNGALESKKIDVVVTCPDSVHVFADRKMLSSVFQNLISNAIKFSKSGSRIEIVVSEYPDEVNIAVRDHGVGMTDDDMKKLFRMDTIHSTYGTDNEIGAGLGLLLVHDFIKQNKGQLSVSSQKGKGTTFSFTLPKKPVR